MFGDRIQQFVLSVDIWDEVIYLELLGLLESYVRDELKIRYFSLLEAHPVNDRPGLQTFWSTREDKPSYSVKNVNEVYTSHTSYVFDKNMPIWVVGDHGQSLQDARKVRDLWPPGADDLPPYSARMKEAIKTSIMIPLRRSGAAFWRGRIRDRGLCRANPLRPRGNGDDRERAFESLPDARREQGSA